MDPYLTSGKEMQITDSMRKNFNNVLKKLSNGELSTDDFAELIKKEQFTTQNLNNVINYVEHFKGVVN